MALTQISTQGIKDGTITGSDLSTNVDLVDNQKLRLGTGNDLQIYHDGHSRIFDSGDGYLNLITNGSGIYLNKSDGESLATFLTDGSVELFENGVKKAETTTDGFNVEGTLHANEIDMDDNHKIKLGLGDDLEIFHTGTASKINNATGSLFIQSDAMSFHGEGGSETMAVFAKNGGVELYHNNTKTFETTGEGVTFDTGSSSCVVRLTSNTDAITVLQAFNSDFLIKAPSGGGVSILTNANESSINCISNGAVELYFNNSLRLSTTANGVTLGHNLFLDNATNAGRDVTWDPANDQLQWKDNTKASFGNNSDLQIYHDGSHSFIEESGTGNLTIKGSSQININNAADTENCAIFKSDGEVELYFDGSLKFETTSTGTRFPEDAYFVGAVSDMQWDSSETNLKFFDNVKAVFGGGSDLQIFHNGSDNFIKVPSGGVGNIIVDLANGSSGFFVRTTSSTMANQTLKNNSSGADGKDFFQCRSNNNTLKMVIGGGGNVLNSNNSYGQISDSKLKENIVDANSQWEDIKNIKVRNWNYKESTGLPTYKQIGVVAQELEIVSPGLVDEKIDRNDDTGEDLGTKTKSVKYSVLYMKAIKCLQEAMIKIEVLETEVAALKAG